MNTQNVDFGEIKKFEQLAERWWDKTSEFKPLHDINPLRVEFIANHSKGLAGKRILDVGCGGGILADEMGLGKTCQVIAFLTHLVETGHPGPHLVVCPGSTLENWLREFQRFSPQLAIEPYHGMYSDHLTSFSADCCRATKGAD